MDSTGRAARLAGWLYLPVVIGGPFVLLYVPGKVFVPGDATATVNSLLAHESLWRAGIAVGIVSELFFVGAVLALYRLLRDVSQVLAALMALLILFDVPLAFLSTANQVATLTLARGADFLAVFEQPQRDALVLLLLKFDSAGALVSQVLWGMWLLPLGLLVYRSRFLPRFLGLWLLLNGLAYVAMSTTGLFFPDDLKLVRNLAMPALFGEMALMLWLLIKGARRPVAP